MKVINNEISGNEGRGINIWGGNAITIEGNKIRNSSGYLGIGLYIRQSSSNVIIKNNLVEGNQEYGIAVGSGSNHNISGNQILNNGRAGIQLGNVATQPGGGGGGDGIVEKNIIKGNGAGTHLEKGRFPMVHRSREEFMLKQTIGLCKTTIYTETVGIMIFIITETREAI